MPAAGTAWPIFDLTLPMAQRPWRMAGARLRKASIRACISIGSPSAVPVPCASTQPIVAGSTRKRAQTASCSSRCAARLGLVSPAERPSWLVPVPSITPWMRSPSAMARASGFSTTAPTPSAGTKPSAAASKVRHRPPGESMRAWLVSTCMPGVVIRATPPATARSHSPVRSAWQARCTATSEDEQAVSTATAGPRRFRW